MTFDQVKAILDYSVLGWQLKRDRQADLSGHDGVAAMSWATREALLAAEGMAYRLIDPGVIGNGKGEEAALVIDLRTGLDGNPRMPRGGPYLDDSLIAKIVQWIDEGCPA